MRLDAVGFGGLDEGIQVGARHSAVDRVTEEPAFSDPLDAVLASRKLLIRWRSLPDSNRCTSLESCGKTVSLLSKPHLTACVPANCKGLISHDHMLHSYGVVP